MENSGSERQPFIGWMHELQERVDQTQTEGVVDRGVIPIGGLLCIEGQQNLLEGTAHRHKHNLSRCQVFVLGASCLDTGSLSALL